MSNDLVKASDVNIDELKRLGIMLATSGYFETAGNRDAAIAQMCVKVLAGRELGFGPFASVNGIHVIKGKPAISANLMAAAVKSSPRYDYKVRQMDANAVKIEFFEIVDGKRESLGISEFTKENATDAGTQNMGKFARNMMFARAMSNGVKWFCPDVFDGNAVYVPEELGATVDGDGNVIDVDYRQVDKATGEVRSTTTPEATPTNGHSNGNMPPVTVVTAHSDNPFDDDVPQVVQGWKSPMDAQAWAVEIGASENEHAARNAFKVIVDAHGGKLTKDNMQAVYIAYYRARMKRAQEKAFSAIESLDDVQEMSPEVA